MGIGFGSVLSVRHYFVSPCIHLTKGLLALFVGDSRHILSMEAYHCMIYMIFTQHRFYYAKLDCNLHCLFYRHEQHCQLCYDYNRRDLSDDKTCKVYNRFELN